MKITNIGTSPVSLYHSSQIGIEYPRYLVASPLSSAACLSKNYQYLCIVKLIN